MRDLNSNPKKVYSDTESAEVISALPTGMLSKTSSAVEKAGRVRAAGLLAEHANVPEELAGINARIKEARLALYDAVTEMCDVEKDYKQRSHEFLAEIRGIRMAVVGEVHALVNPLKEIRQFFIGATHDQEVTRLREFVELCERLEALKKKRDA